jgi:hypothetical protein
MNQRLDAPFTEAEVLKIFSDLVVAVFACHHAKPVRLPREPLDLSPPLTKLRT